MVVAPAVAGVGLVFAVPVRSAHVRIVIITAAPSSFAGWHGVISTEVSMIVKGSRVRAEWFQAHAVSLSGMQMKFGARQHVVTGVVRHLRGDDPVAPKEVRIYIDPEGDAPADLGKVRPYGCTCEGGHVELKLDWAKEIL